MTELTDEQRKIWDWWTAKSKLCNIYAQLSPEDKAVFSQGVKFQDDEISVVRSRKNYVRVFFDEMKNANKATEYSEEQVVSVVLLKTKQMHLTTMGEPKTESDVPAYVFTKCLSKEEQDAFREKEFKENFQRSQQSVYKFAEKVVEWLVKLNVVQEKDRAAKVTRVFEEKMTQLRANYVG